MLGFLPLSSAPISSVQPIAVLEASVASLTTVTADLSIPKPLAASVASLSTVTSASLTTEIRLAASVAASSSVAAAVLEDAPLPIAYVGGKGAGAAGQGGGVIDLTTGLTGGSGGAPITGDLVVVTVSVGTQARAPTIAITTPTGYTALTEQRTTTTTYDTNVQTCYKFMGGTPDTSVTIPGSGNNQDGISYAIQVFRNVDAINPMDVVATYATGTGTALADPAAITPVTAGSWIVVCAGGAAATGANYTAGYLTNLVTNFGADTNDSLIGCGYYTGWTSGEYNPAVFGGGSATANDSWGSTTIALRQAPPQIRLTTSVTAQSSASAVLTTQINLATSAAVTIVASATLTTQINLTSSVAALSTVISADLSIPKALAASVASLSTVTSAALSTQIRLASSVASLSTVTSAGLSTQIKLNSSVAALTTVTAGLSTQIKLNSSVASLSTVTSAGLSTQIKLNSSVASLSTVTSAGLSTQIKLNSSVAALTTVTAGLSTQIKLNSSVAALTTVTAGLTTQIKLNASLAAISTVTSAELYVPKPLASSVSGTSTASGSLTTQIKLNASVSALATADALFFDDANIFASISSQSTATGNLSTAISLGAATSSVANTASAVLTTSIQLSGSISSISSASASFGGIELETSIEVKSQIYGILDVNGNTYGSPGGVPVDGFTPHNSLILGIQSESDPAAEYTISADFSGGNVLIGTEITSIIPNIPLGNLVTYFYNGSTADIQVDTPALVYGFSLKYVADDKIVNLQNTFVKPKGSRVDLVRYSKESTPVDILFTVNARSFLIADPVPTIETRTAVYKLSIRGDYSVGRDALLAILNDQPVLNSY